MAARGDQLADELELRVADLKATIEHLTDDEWSLVCVGEGWPIGFVVYHVSLGLSVRPDGSNNAALAGHWWSSTGRARTR